jgi:hypothetical protein
MNTLTSASGIIAFDPKAEDSGEGRAGMDEDTSGEPTDPEFEDAKASVWAEIKAQLRNKNRESGQNSVGGVPVTEKIVEYGNGAKVRIVIKGSGISLDEFDFALCGLVMSKGNGAVRFARSPDDFLPMGMGETQLTIGAGAAPGTQANQI